jgi:hypothetical protein
MLTERCSFFISKKQRLEVIRAEDEGGRMKDEGNAVEAFLSSFILPPSSFRSR